MALKYVDSFDFWTASPGTFTSLSGSITGGHLHVTNAQSGGLISDNLTNQATYICNLRANVEQINANSGFFYGLYDGATLQTFLELRTDQKVQFSKGPYPGETFLGSPSVQALDLDAGTTYYDLEGKITIGASGSIELRINGGVQIGPSTVNTRASANSYASSARVFLNTATRQATYNAEHFILMDSTGSACNDFIGPVDVVYLPPTANGFYTAWNFTGAASAWEAVETADGDTSYIYASASGDKETFEHDPVPANYTGVKATAVWVMARRDDATTRGFKVLLRDPGGPTDNLSSLEHFVGSSYDYFFTPYEVNPFTSAAWTPTEVSDVEVGVQIST